MARKSITLFDTKVVCASQRRYVLLACRPWDLSFIDPATKKRVTLVKFVRIQKRSDSYATLRQVVKRQDYAPGVVYRIWDTDEQTIHVPDASGTPGGWTPPRPNSISYGGCICQVEDPESRLVTGYAEFTPAPKADAVSAAVVALQAAGWTVVDSDGDRVWMSHPEGEGQLEMTLADA